MQRLLMAAAVILPVLTFGVSAQDAQHANDLKWGPVPPSLPPGGQIAGVGGDPGKEGEYVFRAKVPKGYKMAPHIHSSDEHLTVLSGTFHIGMGDTYDESKGTALKAGDYMVVRKGAHHYAWASEDTILQVHGMGPFAISYVNPADDPSKKN